MPLVLTLAGTYLLAVLATVFTVAFLFRRREHVPEGAIIAYGLLFFVWWIVFLLALGVWRYFR